MVQTAVDTAAAGASTDGFWSCRVSELRHDTDDSVVVTITAPDGQDWSFAHGQHLIFRRVIDGTEIRRSYSLCTAAPDGPLRVAIRHVPGGAFSTWANTELEAGDIVEVMPPTGRFTHDLDPSTGRQYLLVAGGSGITPILSIAETILVAEPLSNVTMLYVNRSSASTMLLDDVDGLRNRFLGRFDLWYGFTQEPTAVDLLDGRPDAARITHLIERGILPNSPDEVFVCGPEGLVDSCVEALSALGVPDEHLHTELFTAGEGRLARPAPQPVTETSEPVATATVTLHGRATDVPVYEGDTILEAAQRLRPDVPYSCRAGVCSTCSAHLDEGEVTMDICHGLDADELARGYVLTCRAVPTTSAVVVDFDH